MRIPSRGKKTGMDKAEAVRLLALEILRRERLARLSSLPEGHRRVIVALRLAVEALEEGARHESGGQAYLDSGGL